MNPRKPQNPFRKLGNGVADTEPASFHPHYDGRYVQIDEVLGLTLTRVPDSPTASSPTKIRGAISPQSCKPTSQPWLILALRRGLCMELYWAGGGIARYIRCSNDGQGRLSDCRIDHAMGFRHRCPGFLGHDGLSCRILQHDDSHI